MFDATFLYFGVYFICFATKNVYFLCFAFLFCCDVLLYTNRIYQFAMPGLFSVIKYIWHDDAPLALLKNTLSLRSQRNFKRWAFLCIKTPSKWPVSTERIYNETNKKTTFLFSIHGREIASKFSYLYCFIAPTHYLTSSNICNWRRHFTPLQK